MRGIALAKARHLLGTCGLLDQAGAPVERLLARVHLERRRESGLEDLLPHTAMLHFRELAARNLGLPNIALELTRRGSLEDLGDMGRLIIGAPTAYRALATFCEFARSEASFLSTGLRPSRDGVWVWHRNETPVVAGLWHTELYVLLFMLKVVQLADSSWHPEEVRFRSDETPDRRRVGEALGCERLVFSRGVTEFLLPSTMLGQSVRPPRPAHSLDPHTDVQRLRAGLQVASISESLNQILRRRCASEWWTMEELAEVVGVPIRTLQRHLREEGTCYSKITREARLERAVDLLEASEMELPEIASDLGFSTHSNFSRAFHQWSGLQPHEFRRRRRTSDPGDGARCSKQNMGIRATPVPVE